MAFDNAAAKAELLKILKAPRQALLLVGSGSSRSVGYPSWGGLLDNLRVHVVPEADFPDGLDLLQRASFIQRTLRGFPNQIDRQRLYRNYLEQTFRPQPGNPTYTALHRALVQLPFCGIATTNYDSVLDSAVTAIRVAAGLDACHAIDLCGTRRHHVFEFLRSLSDDGSVSRVLHIHGYWENSNELILTQEDYAERYGLVDPAATPDDPLMQPRRPLDTFHRKVVWALLTMRPVVFVGFSVDDPAFQLMLSFVHEDFELAPRPPAHVAILSADPNDPDQQERDANRLGGWGVLPVFYDLTVDPGTGNFGHEALPALVDELAATLGAPTSAASINTLSRRLLQR